MGVLLEARGARESGHGTVSVRRSFQLLIVHLLRYLYLPDLTWVVWDASTRATQGRCADNSNSRAMVLLEENKHTGVDSLGPCPSSPQLASVRGEMMRNSTKSRSSSTRLSRCNFSRVTMSSTPRNCAVSTNGTSPSNHNHNSVEDQKDDGEDWSGNEDDEVDADGSKKRKRPMSVSCELCKSRKVCR